MLTSGREKVDQILSRGLCFAVGNIFNPTVGAFPSLVQIETTNGCNAACIICPHKTMRRAIRTMEDQLFLKVIDECAKYKCGNVHLHNFGEPLVDKKIVERIALAKHKGLPRVKIFTNGALLTEKMAEDIIQAGLDEIKISFDGAYKEEYEAIRYPLKFAKIVNNIKRLVAIRDKLNASLKIEVACSSTSDQKDTMIALGKSVDSFSFGKLHNWGDSDIMPGGKSNIRKPCSRIWRTFTVLADGRASLCCIDYEGKVILGDVNTSSIHAIWKNALYKRHRKHHIHARQNRISICAHCSKSYI
jgi:sulfatase maturation enzyme AslB (radical SAM superfamily)